jgi:hypothetical protein
MKAKEFVMSKYPKAFAFPMIDNPKGQTSYVIVKGEDHFLEILPNEGATTASKAWTNAKNFLIKQENAQPHDPLRM